MRAAHRRHHRLLGQQRSRPDGRARRHVQRCRCRGSAFVRRAHRRHHRLLGQQHKRADQRPRWGLQRRERGLGAFLWAKERWDRRMLGPEPVRADRGAPGDLRLRRRWEQPLVRPAPRGTITCWGSNTATSGNRAGQSDAPQGTFTALTAGGFHSCGLRPGGTVTCWGLDTWGQASPPTIYSAISMGDLHLCGVVIDGTVGCAGSNSSGQTDVPDGQFSAVSAGAAHTCGLRADGTVKCWGLNDYGQARTPRGTFISVSAGTWHTCGVRTDTTITCWGDPTWTAAIPPTGAGFKTVTTNMSHTVWGARERPRRMLGKQRCRRIVPTRDASLQGRRLGGIHTCGLRTDRIITCWGATDRAGSDVGMAGQPRGTFKAVGAGARHSCGVRINGTITCWETTPTARPTRPQGNSPPSTPVPNSQANTESRAGCAPTAPSPAGASAQAREHHSQPQGACHP